MQFFRLVALSALLCTSGMLAACNPSEPWLMESTHVMEKPIALVESRHIVKKPLAELSDADIAEAAKIYGRTGAGPIYVVVAYKEGGKAADKQLSAKSAGIASQLQGAGVAANDMVVSSVPLETPTPVALIAFDTLEARAPAGCTPTPGYGSTIGDPAQFNYPVGCGVKAVMAKQIANPRDLEGRAGLGGHNDGNRAANTINGIYRAGGESRDFLPSYVISELAGSGS